MLPIGLWQEITSHLAYNDQLQLKSSCKYFHSTLKETMDGNARIILSVKINDYLSRKNITASELVEYLIKKKIIHPSIIKPAVESMLDNKRYRDNCYHYLEANGMNVVTCSDCDLSYECANCYQNVEKYKNSSFRYLETYVCRECWRNVSRFICSICNTIDCQSGCVH